MKYKVTVTGQRWRRKENPPKPKEISMDNWEGYQTTEEGIVSIDESPCFKYGNGKYMSIVEGFNFLPPDKYGQDIRYDTDYDPKDEIGYIKDYAQYWFAKAGDAGYWKQVDEVKVELI